MKLCLEIRKKTGMYDLVYNNCGHVSQDILEAGGKKFSADSNEGAILALLLLPNRPLAGWKAIYLDYKYTKPNTTFEMANVNMFPMSYKGTLEEIYDYLYK